MNANAHDRTAPDDGPTRHERVIAALAEVLACPELERDAFFRARYRDDGPLYAEVDRILRFTSDLPTFLDADSLGAALAALGPLSADPLRNTLVGPYRLIERIGAGGMGEVYRAERTDGSFRQTVAVKLLREGTHTDEALERFRRERQVLADLTHPNIARLLDGGSDQDGRPYLVMELIEGERITDWARRCPQSLEAIVDRVCAVCEAVEAAHRRMIVHCDLKPSNILVTGSGEVKLLDFGIAQAFDEPDAQDDSNADDDAMGQARARGPARRLSLAYASPEQHRGERPTASTDIYSLGKVLGELMTGSPDDHRMGRGRSRHDLDGIVRRATQAQPVDRYPSMEALRSDLLRWRRHEPVQAHATSWARRTELLLRRRSGAALVAAITFLALAGAMASIISSLVATERARRAEQIAAMQATEEARIAGAVSNVLQDLLGSVDPSVALGRDASLVIDMLDRAAQRIDDDATLPPRARAMLDATLGEAYRDLARYDEAEAHLVRGLEGLRAAGAAPEEIAKAAHHLAALSADTDRFERARAHFEEVIGILAAIDPVHPKLGDAWRGLALVERDVGRYGESEVAGNHAIRLDRENNNIRGLLDSLLERGVLLTWTERPHDACATITEALDIARSSFGDRHPTVARAYYNRAFALRRAGRPADAVEDYRRALSLHRELLHDRHPDIASTLNNLAGALEELGRLDEAEPLYREAIERRRSAKTIWMWPPPRTTLPVCFAGRAASTRLQPSSSGVLRSTARSSGSTTSGTRSSSRISPAQQNSESAGRKPAISSTRPFESARSPRTTGSWSDWPKLGRSLPDVWSSPSRTRPSTWPATPGRNCSR
jgi:eukaryotic-like serine/threonine-protein kinase